MNKQLQLLDSKSLNEVQKPIAASKASRRILGHSIVDLSVEEKPWKLSEKERNQGLAGIAMIKQILANFPVEHELEHSQFAQAS